MSLDTPYSEYVAERQLLGMIVDVSEDGLRVERLLRRSGEGDGVVQLEFELPGTQERIWAKGQICFDALAPRPLETAPGRVAMVRTSGIRVVAAAGKHLRLIRDFVRELRGARAMNDERAQSRGLDEGDADDWFLRASHLRA